MLIVYYRRYGKGGFHCGAGHRVFFSETQGEKGEETRFNRGGDGEKGPNSFKGESFLGGFGDLSGWVLSNPAGLWEKEVNKAAQ